MLIILNFIGVDFFVESRSKSVAFAWTK